MTKYRDREHKEIMEATFQSYLTEAVYEAAASNRGHRHDTISYIDADSSEGEQQNSVSSSVTSSSSVTAVTQPPPLPVKMRIKTVSRRKGPRPSGILEQLQTPAHGAFTFIFTQIFLGISIDLI